ncbi:MAG: peptide chain release factor N(5)-glutamine methyltransferase, partial [Oscillospiraceae bacterium]|nr:peptide chain release factor N(5)-glutamine methyltransferase [Oscillospiraceae bacterium]
MKVIELKNEIAKKLERAEVTRSVFEATQITAKALGVEPSELPKIYFEEADEGKIVFADNMSSERAKGRPLQYIIGEWEFYGNKFEVGEGVLIPRPETEMLLDILLNEDKRKIENAADICSGSGCLAISLAKKTDGTVYAVEISDEAEKYLRRNVELNGTGNVKIIKADAIGFDGELPLLDAILCNPPYLDSEDMKNLQKEVAFEPTIALFGGNDGLDFYRKIPKR